MCSLVALPIMTPADSSPVALRRRSPVPQAVLPLPPLPDRLNPVLLGTPHPSVQDPILHDPRRCWLADSVQWPRAQAPPNPSFPLSSVTSEALSSCASVSRSVKWGYRGHLPR